MRASRRAMLGLAMVGLLVGCARPVLVNVPEEGHGVVNTGVHAPAEISDDGRVVVFPTADYLSPDDHEGTADVYVREVRRRATSIISVAPGGRQDYCGTHQPHLSGDGNTVAWTTCSGYPEVPPPPGTVGTGVYVKDRATGTMSQIGTSAGSGLVAAGFGLLDRDGSHIAMWCFPDVTGFRIVAACVQDRTTGVTTIVSRRSNTTVVPGMSVPTSISDDGNLITFTASLRQVEPGSTDERQQVFVRDVAAGTTTVLSVDPSVLPGDVEGRISGDGTAAVLWQTSAPYRVVHKDLVTGEVNRVDQPRCTEVAPSPTYAWPSISATGDVVAFQSSATELVPNDTNGKEDVFLWRAGAPCVVQRVSVDERFRQGDGDSYWPEVSGDGSTVAFVTAATNLAPDGVEGRPDAVVIRIRSRFRN